MSGASLIPVDAPGEHDDVADLLSIARVTWNRGDHAAAVSFVQRAAEAAMDLDIPMRGVELAKIAAELRATLSVVPAPPVRAASTAPSPTVTPPLVLTPPKPPDTNPGLGFLTAADAVLEDDEPRRDTSIDVPPAQMLTPPLRVSGASMASQAQSKSPAPPRVGPSGPPRPSGQPPPVPSRRPSVPPNGSPAPPKVSTSPMPPRVAPAASVRPAPQTSSAPTPSRGPLPLRVPSNAPPAAAPAPAASLETPPIAGAIVPPAVEPQNVRKSAPWIDEVIGPIASGGGQPVVVGLKARVHFRTDGSLEIGPDIESAGGLPVVVLPQRGEDMATLLKRLKR